MDIIPIYFYLPGKPYEKDRDFSDVTLEEINRITKIKNGTHMQTIGMSPNQFLNEFFNVNF